MSALTPGHVLVLLVVVLVLFGAKKLPDLARGLGQSARVFRAEMRGLEEDARGHPARHPDPESGPERPTGGPDGRRPD